VERLAADERLERLQPVAQWRGQPETSEPDPMAPADRRVAHTADSVLGPGAMPYERLNLVPLREAGLAGAGVRIALLDTGFDTANPALAGASVTAQYDFVFGDSIVRDEVVDQPGAHGHGTAVWSLLAANAPGQLLGVARDASFLLAKTEDVRSETRIEEDHYVAALEWADSIGVDIVSSSLGYLEFDDGFSYAPEELNGDIAVTTVAADAAAERGIVVITAMGNEGPNAGTLMTPADGDSVIAVGAEDSLGVVTSFSARGPTADDRVKPDLSAPGADVYVVTGPGTFGRASGTSFSTPLIAGVAALVKQLHPLRGPVDIRRSLQLHGSNRGAPNFEVGFGAPDGAAAVSFPEGVQPVAPLAASLTTITPAFAWQAPAVPAAAAPVTYRLRLARDSTFEQIVVDTTTVLESFRLPRALRPGESFRWDVTAHSALGATVTVGPGVEHVAPAWATLTSVNAPGGTVLNDPRPTFTWDAPDVDPPIGPFAFDVEVRVARSGALAAAGRQLTGRSYQTPGPLDANTPYRWRVIARLGLDSAITESHAEFVIVDTLVPPTTILFQNFPNPFPSAANLDGGTCIWFDLAERGSVTLDVLDLRGHRVRSLVPGSEFPPTLEAGRYGRPASGAPGTCDPRLLWDGTTDAGTFVPPGVYVYRLRTPTGVFHRRLVFRGSGRS
jgi:hypothetical protein